MAAPPPHHHVVLNELQSFGVVAAYDSPYAFMAGPFGQIAVKVGVSRGTFARNRAHAVVLLARKRVREIIVLLSLMDMDRSSDEEAFERIVGRCSFWVVPDQMVEISDVVHCRWFRSVIRLSYFKVCNRLGLAAFTSINAATVIRTGRIRDRQSGRRIRVPAIEFLSELAG